MKSDYKKNSHSLAGAVAIVMLPGADDELGFRGFEVCY